MTSESKILTVSYGTFSCTLEGFDNPFDTMKAIAEYFRDLAAQDRHFGAEPPPPDAAMLHRLAEREVSRLAGKADDTARLRTPAEPMADPLVAPRIQINPVHRRTVVEPEAAAEPSEPSLQDVIPDGVAAKLARIRRAVNPAAEVAAPFATLDPELAGDEVSFADEIAADVIDVVAPAAGPTADEASEAVAARLGALIASDAGGVNAYDEEEADAVPSAGWTDGGPDEAAGADDLAAAPFLEADAESFVGAKSETFAEADAESVSETDLPDEEYLPADEAALSEEVSEEDLALLAELDGIAAEEALALAAEDEPLPEDIPAEVSFADAALLDPLPETEVADAAPKPVADITDASEPAPPASKSGRRSRRVNSRVVRLHPGDDASGSDDYDFGATRVLEGAGESDEISRLMQQAEEVMAEDENRRRQEALSRLKAAVASTEADRADIDYEAPKADLNLNPYRDDLAEAIQPEAPVEPQAAPDVKPRRKSVTIRPTEPRPGTIRPGMISPAPLVLVSEQRIDRIAPAAAPALSPATPGISPSIPDGQPMVALRTGRLSGAIGAGAAVAASGMPARNIVLEKPSYGPATDAEEDEDLAEDTKEIDESGLAAFAETVGAKSMAEMLEAAAAYATCVENRSQFTRPQLMRRMMASAGGKPVSREDGLRSFGTLLRTGRIEKVTRGHYSLADTSPYLAEARRLN